MGTLRLGKYRRNSYSSLDAIDEGDAEESMYKGKDYGNGNGNGNALREEQSEDRHVDIDYSPNSRNQKNGEAGEFQNCYNTRVVLNPMRIFVKYSNSLSSHVRMIRSPP